MLIISQQLIQLAGHKADGSATAGAQEASATPAPQLPPDDKRAEVLHRLSKLSLEDLERLEHQLLLNELSSLNTETLQVLVKEKRQ